MQLLLLLLLLLLRKSKNTASTTVTILLLLIISYKCHTTLSCPIEIFRLHLGGKVNFEFLGMMSMRILGGSRGFESFETLGALNGL